MQQYKDYLKYILENGELCDDRTGTGRIRVFGYQMRFDLKKGFPMITIKWVPFRPIKKELFWFLRGETNAATLIRDDVNIWNKDAHRNYKEKTGVDMPLEAFVSAVKHVPGFWKNADLGPIYGAQWRQWNGPENKVVDQIAEVLKEAKKNPNSSRLIVNAYNIAELEKMGLPPCHTGFQLFIDSKGLSLKFSMRSNDAFLGAPFNIPSYALLTHLFAMHLGLEVNELIMDVSDAHIYANHVEQVKEILKREPYPMPTLEYIGGFDMKGYLMDAIPILDASYFKLKNYHYHPEVKGEMST